MPTDLENFDFDNLLLLSDAELIQQIPRYAANGNKKELLIFSLAEENQLFTRLSCLLINDKSKNDIIKKVLLLKKDGFETVEYCLSFIDDLNVWLQLHKEIANYNWYFNEIQKRGFNFNTCFNNDIPPVYLFGIQPEQLILYDRKFLFVQVYGLLFNDMDQFVVENELNLLKHILETLDLQSYITETSVDISVLTQNTDLLNINPDAAGKCSSNSDGSGKGNKTASKKNTNTQIGDQNEIEYKKYLEFTDRMMEIIVRGPSQSSAINAMQILKKLVITKQVLELALQPQRLIINIELGGTDELFNPQIYQIQV
ncbi:hypothetical protein HDV01_001337 [Terramyces sp. JEL0728]|nr:hypothetical protein HDV01_001337 [Terramyces sp. JEL0728]